METEINMFIDAIDAKIQAKNLLKHEFYLAWSRGELSKECLCEYAKEYYQHVKAFPTYLSAIHSRTENPETRKILLQNLIEEEAGSPNHPELWKNFAMALGASEEELAAHAPSEKMASLISTFRTICSQNTTAEGIAALYAYESQIPEICKSKIKGLKQYYGMHSPESWKYFSVHIEADKEHAAQERHLLTSYVNTENRQKVNSSVDMALDALWDFLTGMCQKYNIACHEGLCYN